MNARTHDLMASVHRKAALRTRDQMLDAIGSGDVEASAHLARELYHEASEWVRCSERACEESRMEQQEREASW